MQGEGAEFSQFDPRASEKCCGGAPEWSRQWGTDLAVSARSPFLEQAKRNPGWNKTRRNLRHGGFMGALRNRLPASFPGWDRRNVHRVSAGLHQRVLSLFGAGTWGGLRAREAPVSPH